MDVETLALRILAEGKICKWSHILVDGTISGEDSGYRWGRLLLGIGPDRQARLYCPGDGPKALLRPRGRVRFLDTTSYVYRMLVAGISMKFRPQPVARQGPLAISATCGECGKSKRFELKRIDYIRHRKGASIPSLSVEDNVLLAIGYCKECMDREDA